MNAREVWRTIPSAPDYEASSLGRVRRAIGGSGTFSGRVLRPDVGSNGYARVGVTVGGKLKKMLVHRAVCEAFHGSPPQSRLHAAHADGVKTNNRPNNLRWASASENRADISRYGNGVGEEYAGHVKLSKGSVEEIRTAPKSYGFASRLARKFGVSTSCVAAIRNPKRGLWPSVPYPKESDR